MPPGVGAGGTGRVAPVSETFYETVQFVAVLALLALFVWLSLRPVDRR